MSENNKTTPLLEQYFEIKNKHPDTILLFQVGDFFELFFDDAKLVSQALSITLTKRGKHKGADIPICGVPVSSLTYHLTKLVKQGFRVAVCQQVSRPIPGEIVQRKVTRVLTPGTLTEASMLDEKTSSYLCAFWPCGDEWGVLFAELLGAKLFATKIMGKRLSSLDSELARFFPDEILLPHLEDAKSLQLYLTKKGYCTNFTDPAWEGVDLLERGAPSIENYSFGNNACLRSYFENKLESSVFAPLLQHPCLEGSFALLASYLHTYHDNFLPSVEEVKFYQPEDFLVLDNVTLKNLEVVRNNYDGSSAHTLFSAIDRCKTGMGSRALKQALLFPLKNKQLLQQRADFVQTLLVSFINLSRLEEFCATLCDLERIVGRIALARAGWQDYLLLKKGLATAKAVKSFLQELQDSEFSVSAIANLPELGALQALLQASLTDDILNDCKIKPGFSAELDLQRDFIGNTQREILTFERAEATRSKISNLRIRYTDILGYFYEINSNQLSLVPTDYLLLQSLVGRSRFTNDSLKELAYKIANAELQSQQLEAELFDKICIVVREALSPLRRTAHTLAQIDMLFSFAKLAYDNNYCRPTFVGGDVLEIEQGRHPVVEFCSAISFVPNDTKFDQAHRLMILTGPNMGGKSTYLRQVAHIVILAHAGAFVPAKSCRLSIIDRVFTRIGSGDNLAAGKSTFLVEMEEVALICSAANKSSLIILDEVGRGTSTFDGMAIAQAILEYLFDSVAAKTLFATHYHELTVLAKCRSGVNNYHMGCQEVGDNLVFSHRLLQGAAGASFGIAVAKLAGLPVPILARAKELLHEFKGRAVFASDTGMKDNVVVQSELENKLLIYEKVFAEITALPLDDMTPRTAHQFLQKLQQKISETKISD